MNFFARVIKMNSKVITLPNDLLNSKAIEIAVETLNRGGVISVPTDTIYGIAGKAQDANVINRIYQIKSRDRKKPLALCLGSVEEIFEWSQVTVPESLLRAMFPGPFTLIFDRSSKLSEHINPDVKSIGIRIPDHSFILSLCSTLREPLALTSANKSFDKSCGRIDEFSYLWSNLDYVFDGGPLMGDPQKLGSTVIDLSQPKFFRINRPGCALNLARSILSDQFSLKEIF
ncbi:threonyl-carbamoyl synthesis 1 [Brevipalpus obovatus]|uniref:threonyl-carbamoyl synthesis 1 n=1 Tax=Brevipalpus obovatus TaxID=246614 RepID=UPI003D9F056E